MNPACPAHVYQGCKNPAAGSTHWLLSSIRTLPFSVFSALPFPAHCGYSHLPWLPNPLGSSLWVWKSKEVLIITRSHLSDLLCSFFSDLETALQLYMHHSGRSEGVLSPPSATNPSLAIPALLPGEEDHISLIPLRRKLVYTLPLN